MKDKGQTIQSGETLRDHCQCQHGSTTSTKSDSEIGAGRPQIAYLVEPYVVTEVRISVQLRVSTVSGTLPLRVTPKDVNDSVLDFFGNIGEVHIIAAACGAFNLQMIVSAEKE